MDSPGRITLSKIVPQLRRNEETGTIDGEHGVITGQTRFGKTYLSKRIARFFPFVVVHDPKNRYTLDPDEIRIREIADIYKVDPKAPIVIYAPCLDERDNIAATDEFCRYAFMRGGVLVIFDEIVRVGTIHKYPRHLRFLYTGGAEESICVLGLTQEPINVPSFVYTQSAHHYQFYTSNRSHRGKLAGFMPIDDDEIQELQKTEFYYWRNDMREPIGPIWL